ncbi:hypothetical protein [Dysgonomonas sp. 520]|uniref:hypothetical protein n=1 Tax=Dysgonomonas sp. 520 TaxID=2302931 RepID=UPI0013D68ED6|nr:hypothetical protein [Dysgonomonas sp. 520]NDW10495.1 hypothetical protein [Dysgonomonas sp. 520]
MKITYYFGAGASVGALPIVNQIPDRIKQMIELLESDKYKLSDEKEYKGLPLGMTKYHYQQKFIEDLRWLLEKSANHASIDTFAKKLYIRHDWNDLKKLKVVFSLFLIFEQVNNKTDIRYDSFFASILTRNSTSFPQNLRILSWNYDFQFEKAYIEYTCDNRLEACQLQLNIASKYVNDDPVKNKFGITKLNGTTSIQQSQSYNSINYFSIIPSELTLDFLDRMISNYASVMYHPHMDSGLSFAWEDVGVKVVNIIEHAKDESFDTDILIVIGYSFPYFNREIDREIIGNMKNLKKVYFQAPDASVLKERFLSIRTDIPDNMLQERYDVGQFLLPNEL